MKQADLGLNLTRKRGFLAAMERVVPWAALVGLTTPYEPEGKRGRPPFAVETMLRIHFMQQGFTLSDPAMEESLHDVPLLREFAGLNWDTPVPDETTIKRRSAIEPAIGHMKMEGRLVRNPLKGALGDALHTVMCGAGHNLRLILAALRRYCARFGLSMQEFMLHCALLRPSTVRPAAENRIVQDGLNTLPD